MIDNFKIEVTNHSFIEVFMSKKEPFQFQNILFSPKYSKGCLCYWFGEFKNLYIQVIYDKLIVSNSIHKYYKGDNYSDFSLCEFEVAMKALSKQLNINLFDSHIKRFEIGCNILLKNPKPFLDGLISYNGNYFQPMLHKNKLEYGKKLFATDYSMKFYNKTFQVLVNDKIKINESLLRCEFEVKHLRYLQKKGIAIYKVLDFFNFEILNSILLVLLGVYKGIHKINLPDLATLDAEELKYFAVLKDPEITRAVKVKDVRNYFNYKRILSKKIDNSLFNKAEKLISVKIKQLIGDYFSDL